MKESAIFINASRGKTVDEEALIQALQNEEIDAAGLDVFRSRACSKGQSPSLNEKCGDFTSYRICNNGNAIQYGHASS